VKSAIETHELLYQVFTRHTFLPEAFTTNFDIHWGQYPLRPEFAESTYLLYKVYCIITLFETSNLNNDYLIEFFFNLCNLYFYVILVVVVVLPTLITKM